MRKTFYFKTLSNDADRGKDFLLPLEPLETLADADDEEDFLLPLETLEFLGDAASYVSEILYGDEEDGPNLQLGFSPPELYWMAMKVAKVKVTKSMS
ncbi:hypothetical protein HN51_066610 [Arachis hypogaea]